MKILKSKSNKVVVFRNQKYEKIKKQLIEQGCLFTDLTFPATAASLGPLSSNTLTAIEWKRPKDLSVKPRLFDRSDSMTNIESGELSSNWIVSAFKILSGVRELCYKIVINYPDQEWDLEKEDQYAGIFHFRFWRFGQWFEVVIDDLLPTVNGKLVVTHSSSKDEYWVSLVEKAYAKLLGSYDNLEEGHISDALIDMTGGVTEIIDLKAREYDSSDDRRHELLHLLTSEMANHSIICASVLAYTQEELGQRTEVGLVRGQAYHIVAIKKIHLGDVKLRNLFKGRERVAMVKLRGTGVLMSTENSPNKSINSNTDNDCYVYSTSQLTRLLSKNPIWAKMKESQKERIGLQTERSGEFWMPFEDFVANLEELSVIRLFNNNLFSRGKKWHESSIKGVWTIGDRGSSKDRSGGGNINSETFLKNPQYMFEIGSEDEELTVQMLQWDGVEPATPTSSSQIPRPYHRTLLIGFAIIKVEINRKHRLHKLISFCQPLVTLDHQRKRELYYRGFFPKGRYLLVPTTFKPGAEGSFLIRMFSEGNIRLREIQRDVPKQRLAFFCLSSPVVWVTAILVKGAAGLGPGKNVYCLLKCENQKVKSQLSRSEKEIEWNDVFLFYRKRPDEPIVVKVFLHHMLMRDKLLGWTELPAPTNHSVTQLEAILLRKDNSPIENAIIKLEMLTEDDLMAI